MGSKNRIFLGVLPKFILQFLNIKDKDLYITKLKYKKVKVKHFEMIAFIDNNTFQKIIDNTFAVYKYQNNIFNFVSFVDDKYILYPISINNFYNEIGTLFYTSKKKLIKEDLIFLDKKLKYEFEIN